MVVLKRLSDGSIHPYTHATSRKPGFVVVDDPTIKPYDGPATSRVALRRREGAEKRKNELTAEFTDQTDAQLAAHLKAEYGIDAPADMPREQMIQFIAERRAVASIPSAPEVPAAPAQPAPAAEADNGPYAGKSKAALVELAKVQYAYDMPEKLTREQMIAQLNQLAEDAKAAR